MTVTLELSKEDIDALNNATVIFGREVHGAILGCDSWLRDKMEEKYPEIGYDELDEKLTKQVRALNRILLEILDKEAKLNENLG